MSQRSIFSFGLCLFLLMVAGCPRQCWADKPAEASKDKVSSNNREGYLMPSNGGEFFLWPKDAHLAGNLHLNSNGALIGWWSGIGDLAQWDIEIPQQGRYAVCLVRSCGNKSGGRYLFKICSRSIKCTSTPTGGWGRSVTTECLGTFYIKEGSTRVELPEGQFHCYLPPRLTRPLRVLVVVHGSLSESDPTAMKASNKALHRWIPIARNKGIIVIAPAFDKNRFGGYRGLAGRTISADAFIFRMIEYLQKEINGQIDSRFYLWGHSAGGQFTHRFALMNSDRLISAVASSSGNYCYPNGHDWPYGLKRCPSPTGLKQFGTVPLAIVVGELDEPQGMGGRLQKGDSRQERGWNWVRDINEMLEQKGRQPCARYLTVPNIGHTGGGLSPVSALYLFEINRYKVQLADN